MAALLIPQGIVTDKSYAGLFRHLLKGQQLASVRGFVNEQMLFPAVLHHVKFCIMAFGNALSPGSPWSQARFSFNAETVEESFATEREHELSYGDIARLNPDTKTCPVFSSGRSAQILAGVYAQVPTLAECGFPLAYGRTLHMKNAGKDFLLRGSGGIPVIESKMIHQYNHRFAGFGHLPPGEHPHILPQTELSLLMDANFSAQSCYEMRLADLNAAYGECVGLNWRIVYRRITSLEVSRTVAACIVPNRGISDSLMIIDVGGEAIEALFLLGCINSFVFDFTARRKQGGKNLSQYIYNHLAMLDESCSREACTWSRASILCEWIGQRVLELSCNSWELGAFAKDTGYDGPPFTWDDDRRFWMQCELDAAFFQLYDIDRKDIGFVMDSFWVVMDRELKTYGRYRTKDTILEIYDEMAEAIRTGQAYQTRLDPPPGPPTDTDGNGDFIPMAEWDPNNWPPHIHPPKEPVE